MTDLPASNRSFTFAFSAGIPTPQPIRRQSGFTLLELLTVIAIIVVLAGLILGGMGYAQQKAASARAASEIGALSNLLEAFKADFGDYPKLAQAIPKTPPANTVSAFLAFHLFGKKAASTAPADTNVITDWAKKNSWPESGFNDPSASATVDVTITNPTTAAPLIIKSRWLLDPFGNPYGYSTSGTYNPTFDLWSTAGATATPSTETIDSLSQRWVKNW